MTGPAGHRRYTPKLWIEFVNISCVSISVAEREGSAWEQENLLGPAVGLAFQFYFVRGEANDTQPLSGSLPRLQHDGGELRVLRAAGRKPVG